MADKRYNLVLPADLYKEVERIATARQSTVVEVLRQFIKLGLLVTAAEDSPDSMLLIRQGGVERQIILL